MNQNRNSSPWFLDRDQIIPISRGDSGGMHTGTWSNRRPAFIEKISPCQFACPNGNPIPRALFAAADGRWDAALAAFLEETPLPGVCGRVCHHPCQLSCNRIGLDGAVEIRLLERTAADQGRAIPKIITEQGKDYPVAVVGGGPAGISAAYHLSRLGHPVTLFEREKTLGGLLRFGIPEFRLSTKVLDAEIERLSSLPITLQTGRSVDIGDLDALQADFKAVFMATGALKPITMNLPGKDLEGVCAALDFLKDDKIQSRAKGARVVVIGGGNTAMDAARVALRKGAQEATVVYRRSRDQMPAFPEEIREAQDEGVQFKFLAGPAALVANESQLSAVHCQCPTYDPQGECLLDIDPHAQPDIEIPCDLFLTAIGQSSPLSQTTSDIVWQHNRIKVDDRGRTSRTGVYAGGDVIPGSESVVDAIAAGKRAAVDIHFSLTNRPDSESWHSLKLGGGPALSIKAIFKKPENWAPEQISKMDEFDYLGHPLSSPLKIDHREPELRRSDFKEVTLPLKVDKAKAEAERCFYCGTCIGCDRCHHFCPEMSFESPTKGSRAQLYNDDYCKGCGTCASVCPRNVLTMVEKEVAL